MCLCHFTHSHHPIFYNRTFFIHSVLHTKLFIIHFFYFIYNCRHFYCLIEMAIMQCFNGQYSELTNTHFHVHKTKEITIVTISFKCNYFRRRVHFSIVFSPFFSVRMPNEDVHTKKDKDQDCNAQKNTFVKVKQNFII